MVSPDMNPNNFYNVIYGAPGSGDFVFGRTSSRLGSTDSGVWRSVNGTQKYDSWRISPALSIPEFFVRTNWLVTETTVPASGTQVALTLKDNFSLIDANRLYNNAAGNDYGIKVINYGPMGVDNNGNLVPMSSGTLFGSVLLAKRASAASMINVPVGSGGQFQQSGCTTKAQSNVQLNRLAVGNCANGTMSISNSSTFTYGGSSPAPGTLSIYAGFQYAGDLGTSGAGVAVIGPSGPLMSATLNSGSAGVNGALGPINWQAATSNITWQPGQIYTIGFSAYSGPATVCRRVGIFNESKKCDNFWPTAVIGWNGPAVMTFQ
jgi:hypothetical protein